jgi:hypothetical protein
VRGGDLLEQPPDLAGGRRPWETAWGPDASGSGSSSRVPARMRFGSSIPLASASADVEVPWARAISLSVSPGWTV